MAYTEDALMFPEFKEHAKKKQMWAGSKSISEYYAYIKNNDNKFEKTKVHYSAAMFKYFDEIIVNALDQYTRAANAPKEFGGPLTQMDFAFDTKTGEFQARNNGPGIHIKKCPELDNKYSVEGIMTRPFAGSNHDDDPYRTTGGVNGVGIKVVNANSKYFEIETVDIKRNLFYRQRCRDGMNIIDPPTVLDLTKDVKKLTPAERQSHTTVKFLLDYPNVCKDEGEKESNWFTPENAQLVEKLLEFRIHQVALAVSSLTYRTDQEQKFIYNPSKVKITFNQRHIKVPNTAEFARQLGISDSVSVALNGSKFPWHICFGDNAARNPNWINEDPKQLMHSLEEETMTIINGVHVSLQSNHLRPIWNHLGDQLQPKAEQALKTKFASPQAFKTLLKKFIYIVDCRQVPIQQLFNSQTKDSITLGTKLLNEWAKDYPLDQKTTTAIWNMIKPKLEYVMLTKTQNQTRKKPKYIRKYEPAKFAGGKKSKDCALLIPEGDSAAKPIEDILKSKKHGLGMDFYGMYNIQGVPPNAIKETKLKEVGGKTILQKSPMMQKNVSFQGLVDAINLNYDFTYDPDTTKGDEEFKTLNYAKVIVAVDQDLDGIGQIFSLIMVFFARFWPKLMKRKFLHRFATPIIRVYASNGDVLEFFSELEFDEWKSKNDAGSIILGNDEDDEEDQPEEDAEENTSKKSKKTKQTSKKYHVKYYKGLATHSEEEVYHMGQTFHDNIYEYVWDDEAEYYMNVYFADDTNIRKEVLSSPVNITYDRTLYRQRKIKCSEHFLIEAKAQKLDFVSRKLKHSLDGLIPVQRKAFAGARKAFSKSTKPKKVYQVTGRVTTDMCYQHGDTSMNDTITKMAQHHTGACNIPLFVAISAGFGDRREDRGTTGSARYIETTLNKRLTDILFPPEDDFLLQYVYEEGKQCEPLYYVPIVPYSIIESLNTPSVGWAITCWGRDFKTVLQEVREMITWNYPNPAGKPRTLAKKYWTKPGMKMDYMIYGSSNAGNSAKAAETCSGSYKWDPKTDELTITQLPPQIWSKHFVCRLLGLDPKTKKDEKKGLKLDADPLVHKAVDMTCDDEVCIKIQLKPGAYDQIQEKYGNEYIDPIEDYFGLTKSLSPNINMILADTTVRTFVKYEEVLEYWFEHRKQLYQTRLERRRRLLEYEIIYYENMLRFIEMDAKEEINIDKKTDSVRDQILEEAEFTRINKQRLFKPLYLKLEELKDNIFDPAHGASYKYIDAITVGQKSEKNIQKLEDLVETKRAELVKLNKTTVNQLWLDELQELEETVEFGLKTKWLYTTKKHNFKRGTK